MDIEETIKRVLHRGWWLGFVAGFSLGFGFAALLDVILGMIF